MDRAARRAPSWPRLPRRRPLQLLPPCSSRCELLDEACERVLELPLDALPRLCRVDARDPARLALRELEIRGAHPLEERSMLALEAVVLAARNARAADLDGRIEQQREIGLEAALHAVAHALEERAVDTSPAALVGERRISEAVAYDPVAALESRHDHPSEMLRPRREHQERLRLGGNRLFVLAVQEMLA